MRVAVCGLSEIADGSMKAVEALGSNLVVVRRGAELFALRDLCPHCGARLSSSVVTGKRPVGGVGEYAIDEDTPILRCPWRNWEFDVESSRCHQDTNMRVAIYPAESLTATLSSPSDTAEREPH